MARKKNKVQTVMGEFKRGTLHSGKKGPIVKSRDQALAIAISEQKKARRPQRSKKAR